MGHIAIDPQTPECCRELRIRRNLRATGVPDGAAHEQAHDNAVLGLLLDEEHVIWSIAEVGQMLDSQVDGVGAINRLHAADLVHRLGEYVFAIRAAAIAWALAE